MKTIKDTILFILSSDQKDMIDAQNIAILSDAKHNNDGTIPYSNVMDIYMRRAEHLNYQYGFAQLIPALQAYTGDRVRLNSFKRDNQYILVFSDVALTEILGMLVIPIKK